MNLGRYFLPALLILMSSAPSVHAQVDIGASPNPVGSGARAMGMGGAFIAVADDATAASWNPAGLVQLERPEVSAVGNFGYRSERVRSKLQPGLDGTDNTGSWELNYLSAAYPFTVLERNVVASLNYQRLYDFNTDLKGGVTIPVGPGSISTDETIRQRGGLSTVSPAVAVQLTPELSVGFTLNVWADPFQDNGWKVATDGTSVATIPPLPPINGTFSNRDTMSFYGTNFHVGVMYNATPSLTVGAVYKSGFIANIRRDRVHYDSTLVTPLVVTRDYLNLTMPESYGIGAAYRFSDSLTVAMDAYRTEWGEFIMNEGGVQSRPNISKTEAGTSMDATTQVRLGGEYLFIKPAYTVPVRLGVFYDPEPSERNPNDFYGLSAGSGISYGPIAFDAAYTFRTGKTRESLKGNLADSRIYQHAALFSVIYHF